MLFSRCAAAASVIRCFPFSATRIYSQLHHQDEQHSITLVSSFNQLLHQNPKPPIIQFGKILGSLVKLNQHSTVISLH
jgi:hypothetical protein